MRRRDNGWFLILMYFAVVAILLAALILAPYFYWGTWDCVFSRCVTVVEVEQ